MGPTRITKVNPTILAGQFLDVAPVLRDLCDKFVTIQRSSVSVRVQLNVHSASRNFGYLFWVHKVKKTSPQQCFVINFKYVGKLSSEIVLFLSGEAMLFCIVVELKHDCASVFLRTEIELLCQER